MKELTRERQINENTWFCTDIEQGEYLLCKSRMFEFEGGCWAHSLADEGYMSVRLDLPDDHPVVVDAREDIGPTYAEVMEIMDIVPMKDLQRPNGSPIETWTRSITSAERAERHRRNGGARIDFPELSSGLRSARSQS